MNPQKTGSGIFSAPRFFVPYEKKHGFAPRSAKKYRSFRLAPIDETAPDVI